MTEPQQPTRPALQDAVQAFFMVNSLLDPIRLRMWDTDRLTITQLRLMAYVAEGEGIGNAELAERLLVTRPSVSALLDRLERGGFIRREIAPNDRRGIRIWLEDRGRQALNTARQENRAFVEHLFEALDDAELAEINRALRKLTETGRSTQSRDLERTAYGDPQDAAP
jgi:DNA-binding MarR family transcriptional regulator